MSILDPLRTAELFRTFIQHQPEEKQQAMAHLLLAYMNLQITDSDRLAFVLRKRAFLRESTLIDSKTKMYELYSLSSDGEEILLSQDGWLFSTANEAIDHAIFTEKDEQGAQAPNQEKTTPSIPCFNSWFVDELEKERQKVLSDDKWMLASTSYEAGIAKGLHHSPWRQVVDEALSTYHVGAATDHDDLSAARRKMQALLLHAQSIGAHFADEEKQTPATTPQEEQKNSSDLF